MTDDGFDKALESHNERIRARVEENPDLDPPIRDASTLILLRTDSDRPRVLMGKRSSAHAFMPDVYVFPGGRVDDGDELPQAATELNTDCETALATHAERPTRAFPLTAIRETLEETGLVVGRAQTTSCDAPDNWRHYYDLGATPDLGKLAYLGRAVTPPGNKRRYDTRFMIAYADEALMDDRAPVDGAELSDLNWLTLEDAQDTDLPIVTRYVIRHLHKYFENPDAGRRRFNWRWVDNRFDVDDI